MALQRDLAIAQELEAIRQANQNLEQRLAMDVQFVEATNAGINLCQRPHAAGPEGDHRPGPGRRAREVEELVDRSARLCLPVGRAGDQADLYRLRHATLLPVPHAACFAAGTLVQTIDGPQPIESIRVGDQVLSQGTSTGQLAFQPVVATHRNRPTRTLRIAIGGESIVATGIHRFWKAGKGWTMARELKAGDRLRMVGGTVEIESIETDKTQPVYNLDVAENRDFFVGTKGLLVHDFSFVQPVLEPFDRQSDLASQAPDTE